MITILNDWSADIPREERLIGYAGENEVEQRVFLLPPGYGEWIFRLDLQLADGSTDIVLPERETSGGGDKLVWTIQKRHLTRTARAENLVTVQCRADKGGQVKKSALMLFRVNPSLEVTQAAPVNPSEIEQTEQRMDQRLIQAQAARDGAQAAAVEAEQILEEMTAAARTFAETTAPAAVQATAAAGAEQVALAAEQASRAEAEADRAAAIDAYTKDAADNTFAESLRGTAAGEIAHMEDVSALGTLRRAAVLGATTETGEGDKGPDNPYTIGGAEPTQLTVCGRNLLAYPYADTTKSTAGIAYTDHGDGTITATGTCAGADANFWLATNTRPYTLQPGSYILHGCPAGGGSNSYLLSMIRVTNGEYDWVWQRTEYGNGIAFTIAQPTQVAARAVIRPGITVNAKRFMPQLEVGDNASAYEPYTGQTIPLPALEPLYGDGIIYDEYDAASGVETRRWGRVALDGTGNSHMYNGMFYLDLGLPTAATILVGTSSHYPYRTYEPGQIGVTQAAQAAVVYKPDGDYATDEAGFAAWKAFLAAQYAAGTPVTILYPLAEPIVTQHDPAVIVPPAPVCNVFAEEGSVDVTYNRDLTLAFARLQEAVTALPSVT